MNNELAGAVLTADVKAQYDAQCKLVLSQKEVPASKGCRGFLPSA